VSEIIERYDEKGNRTYYRDSGGFETWREYDANNHCTHYRDSEGNEYGTPRKEEGR